MRYLVFVLALAACDDDRRVEIFGPAGTKIEVHTRQGNSVTDDACEVSASIVVPQVTVPVLVPMPLPYTPLAEKPQ